MTNYSLSTDSNGPNLVIIYDNGSNPVPVPPTHPRFDKILSILRSGEATDEQIEELVDMMGMLGKRLTKVTDRVSVTPYAVFVDGDPLDAGISEVISRAFSEGDVDGLNAAANFLEKCFANPSLESVDQLYKWLRHKDLLLLSNGNFLAYKACLINEDGKHVSVTQGTAFVDGEEFTGHIPNDVGSIISMPRSQVDANGSVGCSTGLHAGTHAYASQFAKWQRGQKTGMLLVEINPVDVVSSPDDYSFSKLRVQKYVVKEQISEKQENVLYVEEVDNYENPDDTQPEMADGELISDGDFEADTPVGESELDQVEKEELEKPEDQKHGPLRSIANFFKGV